MSSPNKPRELKREILLVTQEIERLCNRLPLTTQNLTYDSLAEWAISLTQARKKLEALNAELEAQQ